MKENFEQEEYLQLVKDIYTFSENESDPMMVLGGIFSKREDMNLVERLYNETKKFQNISDEMYDYYTEIKTLIYDYMVINPYYELTDIFEYLGKERSKYNIYLTIKAVIDCESELENIDTVDETLENEILDMLNDEIEE